MNEDELKNLWQHQPLRTPDLSAAQLLSLMQTKTNQFRRDVRMRDIRELLACAIVVIIFTYYFIHEVTPVVRLGWLIVIGSSFFIAGKLVHARRSTPAAPPGATLIESLRAELNSVRTQSRLLGSVLWWYLLPLGIGLLIGTWGTQAHLHAKIPATVLYVVVYGFVYWLNQWARSKYLVPMEAQLESLLHSAETGETPDDRGAADPRPIVYSMAAADRIQPAEFNVAFLQIALFAEIGFVGIWFFGMLDRTHGHLPDVFNAPRLLWMVPFFVGGLFFSWLIYKGTERAVGISPLGVHLARGYQLLLWDDIHEVRPLRVLHIRSLWLIKESGEKVIMPWTSLHRHSELRAAVEKFAPANHPLRKHLSLL